MRRGVVGAVAVVGLVAAIGGAWWLRGGLAARPRLVPLERATLPEEPQAEPRVDGAPLAADASLVADAPLDAEAAAQRSETRGPRATVVRHGRVVAADSGIELADAVIRLPAGAPGGLLRDGLFSLQRGHALARSDANGRFAASVAADASAEEWIVVAAVGYAPRAVAATELGESAGAAPTFALERPARLRATVVAVDGAPAAGVTVRLLEQRGATRFVVEASSDATGVALLDGVPPERELAVELIEGMALLERESVTMRFAAGAQLTRRFALRANALISGRVLDERGLPVEGAVVDTRALLELEAGRTVAEERLRHEESLEGALRWWRSGVATDRDGRFVLPMVEPCFAVVGVERAPVELPTEARWGPALALAEVAPGRRSATVILPVERGLAITGRLLGPEGEPVAGSVAVDWSLDYGRIEQQYSVESDAEGRFAFHGVSRRMVLQLVGRSRDGALESLRPVAARVADGEVTLRLASRQRLLVRARGKGVRQELLEARLFAADGSEWLPRRRLFEPLESEEALEAAAVPAGRYDLWLLALRWPAAEGGAASGAAPHESRVKSPDESLDEAPPFGTLVAWVRGVEVAGSGTTTVEAELQRAARLELPKVDATNEARLVGVRVLLDGRLFFKGRLDTEDPREPGRPVAETLHLPPGPVTLEWIVDGRKQTEQLTLLAGETHRAAPPRRE